AHCTVCESAAVAMVLVTLALPAGTAGAGTCAELGAPAGASTVPFGACDAVCAPGASAPAGSALTGTLPGAAVDESAVVVLSGDRSASRPTVASCPSALASS